MGEFSGLGGAAAGTRERADGGVGGGGADTVGGGEFATLEGTEGVSMGSDGAGRTSGVETTGVETDGAGVITGV